MEPLHSVLPQAATPLHTPASIKVDSCTAEQRELNKVTDDFEALLALQLIRTMESSLNGGNMMGEGTAGDVYSGLTEWELARVMARSADFGIKNDILRQMQNREETDHALPKR